MEQEGGGHKVGEEEKDTFKGEGAAQEKLLDTDIPDSREISEMVSSDVKVSEITEFGPEKLAAGPGIGASDEIIIVEGRADVLNLLRNDMENAIAVGGAASNIPKTIIDLINQKDATLFLDGDREGT